MKIAAFLTALKYSEGFRMEAYDRLRRPSCRKALLASESHPLQAALWAVWYAFRGTEAS